MLNRGTGLANLSAMYSVLNLARPRSDSAFLSKSNSGLASQGNEKPGSFLGSNVTRITWCANIFVGRSVTPTFFYGRSLPFLILSIILKNEKNLYVGSFNFFLYTFQMGSNWYMDLGVRDLEVAFFKANST